jgi:hypothetical protein
MKNFNPKNYSINNINTKEIHKLIELCEDKMMEITKVEKKYLDERTTRNVSKRI